MPALGLEDIRTPDVAAIHATVAEDGGKMEANRCVELLRPMTRCGSPLSPS